MVKSDCIFCKIANGEIPSATAYEDDQFRAIFDIAPASKGHMIILPKQHAANVFEASEETVAKIYGVAKKLAGAAMKEFGCDGVNILQNNGEVAGQTVFHLHMHVIPRYKDDTVNIKWKQGEQPSSEELEQMKETIKKAL